MQDVGLSGLKTETYIHEIKIRLAPLTPDKKIPIAPLVTSPFTCIIWIFISEACLMFGIYTQRAPCTAASAVELENWQWAGKHSPREAVHRQRQGVLKNAIFVTLGQESHSAHLVLLVIYIYIRLEHMVASAIRKPRTAFLTRKLYSLSCYYKHGDLSSQSLQ